MKKSLFAVAALSAIAGVAQAQSSVTVYGIIDAGYIGSNQIGSAGSGLTTPQNVKTQQSAFGQSGEQSSRLGFKGTEDLGGGSSAFFTIEMGLNPQLGNLSGSSAAAASTYDKQSSSNTSGSAIDNRQTFVGIKKQGVGQIAFGRQYTTIFNAAAATSPGQFNNIVGDAIYAGSTAVTDTYGGQYYLAGFTNRADNQMSLSSDTFAGFKANAFMAMDNRNATSTTATGTTQAGGNSNWNGWGIGADYTWNKLFLTANTQQFRTKIDSTAVGSAGIMDVNGAAVLGGQAVTSVAVTQTNQTDKQNFFGATYDFGILKAYAQYVGRTVYQNVGATSGNMYQRSAQQIGVRSYITPVIETWASAGMGRVQGNGTAVWSATLVNGGASKFNAYQLGANYYLSKRTNLYGIFGSTQTTNSVSGISGSGSSANQYALGIRHTF